MKSIKMKNSKAGKQMKLSAGIGLLAALLSIGYPGLNRETSDKKDCPQILAWWGTLYPKFCFQDGAEDAKKAEISFWLAKVLDWW